MAISVNSAVPVSLRQNTVATEADLMVYATFRTGGFALRAPAAKRRAARQGLHHGHGRGDRAGRRSALESHRRLLCATHRRGRTLRPRSTPFCGLVRRAICRWRQSALCCTALHSERGHWADRRRSFQVGQRLATLWLDQRHRGLRHWTP